MAWWSRWFERRAWTLRELQSWSDMGLTEPTAAGLAVTPQLAASVPAVFSCLQVLSQDVARTPIRFKEQIAPDTYVDVPEHPLYELLHDLPNPEMTAYQFKAKMMGQLLLYGVAYAQVVRVEGRITALWPLDSAAMRVDRSDSHRKRWTYTAGGKEFTWLFDASQPPILELVSESPIQRCRALIGTALALEGYIGTFFKNGAKPAGILTAPNAIDPSTATRIRDYWSSTYGGAANAHKTPLLDAGLTYTPISSSNEHAQLNEMVRAINEQIAGAFRVPTWKIGDLSKTTYSNMESGETSYVVSTLDPYFELFEESIQRDLLTTRQFGRYSVQFDRSALIRSDLKSLHDSLATGIQNGIYSQNDARKRLGLNPIPDGDDYYRNSALVTLDAEREAKVPSVA
jgi:HK97 family phage portal protein